MDIQVFNKEEMKEKEPIILATSGFLHDYRISFKIADMETPFKLKIWRNESVDNIYFENKEDAIDYADISSADRLILTQFKPEIKVLRYRYRLPAKKDPYAKK